MGLVRRDWTWNKADLGSHLPPSSLDRQFLLICLVPDTAVSTQRFALSLSFIASVYSPGDLIHSNAGVSSLQAQIGPSCHISGSIRLDIKSTMNAICLNHSETISPPLVLGKIVFHEIGESESHSVVSHSLQPHGLYSPWNSPGQNTGVGSLYLPQGIFPTQGSNPGLLRCMWSLYQLSPKRLGTTVLMATTLKATPPAQTASGVSNPYV